LRLFFGFVFVVSVKATPVGGTGCGMMAPLGGTGSGIVFCSVLFESFLVTKGASFLSVPFKSFLATEGVVNVTAGFSSAGGDGILCLVSVAAVAGKLLDCASDWGSVSCCLIVRRRRGRNVLLVFKTLKSLSHMLPKGFVGGAVVVLVVILCVCFFSISDKERAHSERINEKLEKEAQFSLLERNDL
jgi:hypothetical protein